jgi:tRNA(fMet)-specific endonuclease VapC
MSYLLDSNVLSDLMHDVSGRAAQRVAEVGIGNVITSRIVLAELRYGLAKRFSQRLAARLDQLERSIEVADFIAPCETAYGEIRAALERKGTPIGAVDYFIAAQCIGLDHTLVTDNEREFSRVPGLKMENWLR